MKLWQKIIVRLFYLTPIGYFLSTLDLLSGERIKGINIDLESYSPIRAKAKNNPTATERFNWLVNGIFLLGEGVFVIYNNIAGDLGGGFALVAIIFGTVSLITAIFPRVSWNKRISL